MRLKECLLRFLSSIDEQLCNDETQRLQQLSTADSWSSSDKQIILQCLTTLLCDESFTEKIASNFRHILKEILCRLEKSGVSGHVVFIVLSKLIGHYFDADEFVFTFFSINSYSPFEKTKQSKRRKIDENETVSQINLLTAALNYLCFDAEWSAKTWNWSPLLSYLQSENNEIRFLSMECLRILSSMDDKHFFTWTSKYFDPETEFWLRNKYSCFFSTRKLDVKPFECTSCIRDQNFSINSEDITEDLVSVRDILLRREKNDFSKIIQSFVLIPSLEEHLKSITLSVSFGEPILVEGPVGCGKTSLIEYLAQCTNRMNPPYITKIQIGGQIDSKQLIGAHCCTDIPGEFVWKPGPLTECFVNGHWLVIEDIDCAPADVSSTLTTIMKTKSLSSIVGYPSTKCTVHKNFRLFFTRRLTGNHSGTQFSQESIYKMCNVVTLEAIGKEELKILIDNLWPKLKPITEKLIRIYFLFQEANVNNQNFSFGTVSNRTVTLRDLLKCCKRVNQEFRVNSDESALSLFLNICDCFFQSLPILNDRLILAEKLGAKLNFSTATSKSLIVQRKPEIRVNTNSVTIGRIKLKKSNKGMLSAEVSKPFFAYTHQSLNLMEKISVCVYHNEPVLLVGETGTGKTSSVQYLAHLLNKKLVVINMNQQSDACDLLGGYKPVEFKIIVQPLRTEFESLFTLTFNVSENTKFLNHVSDCFHSNKWSNLFSLIIHVQKKAIAKKIDDVMLYERWKDLGSKITRLQSLGNDNPVLGFSFVEGSLVKAMTSGEWILLDEINLAEAETLQCLSSILDSQNENLSLFEKADNRLIKRHPDFRLFACMNPATDVGKKELPLGIRNRFTEFFVEDLECESDLRILVQAYLNNLIPSSKVESIVKLYLNAKKNLEYNLSDTSGVRPHYSLRTLCRALRVSSTNPCSNIQRSLFEAFSLSFLTQLNRSSHILMETIITNHILEKNAVSIKKSQIPKPEMNDETVFCEGYWISKGPKHPYINPDYILTASVRKNIQDLSRIVSLGKTFPILLQGETSVGKTSLIHWLAEATGNVCVRVNNHEHTDLQEYVGTYCVDSSGKLYFKEGVLVEAMRKGYWIILDELNLASTEVLEALNRVLDDNRELFIPEKQEVVKAHSKFVLFATQNPPESYGGRKLLSRAFRNRFVELHFDEIPCCELEFILHEKCRLPLSYAKKMVGVLIDLRVRRRESGVFFGKHSFITLRDLFRWGERFRRTANECQEKFKDWDLYLANEGFLLLAGRVRKCEEAEVVKQVLEARFKRKLDMNSYFNTLFNEIFMETKLPPEFQHLVWTENLKKLTVLMFEALKNKEPLLLIGDTGCGKTTVCQLYAALKNLPFFAVNCHLHTESADFLGSLRPVRSHEGENNRLFEWVDGPLINAMEGGAVFLVDEISLADDSVLERLNSVLEPERTLLLSERALDNESDSTGESSLIVTAKDTFSFVATMNPGGDYGKKELSPALRNRFTEIWCNSESNHENIEMIAKHNLREWILLNQEICEIISKFFVWFQELKGSLHISVRDILSVVQFINQVTNPRGVYPLTVEMAVHHAISMVVIDSIGSGNASFINSESVKAECERFLQSLITSTFKDKELHSQHAHHVDTNSYFGISPFYVRKCESREQLKQKENFVFDSPIATSNTLKLLRSMQINKPLLLEGSPGVGKTSLIQAVANSTGHKIVRINLSEQTDIGDLFGADLPVEGSEGSFSWRDGPLLQALKTKGTWIILDELNLASQSVLEGLNACLDHRGEIFIPELGKTFIIDKNMTRIFGCQNPYRQGGARKGLPQSFLNRFTVVFIECLTSEDLEYIVHTTFPNINKDVVSKLVLFNQRLITHFDSAETCNVQYEFNLRDLFRVCQLLESLDLEEIQKKIDYSANLIYFQRLRSVDDCEIVKKIYEDVFFTKLSESSRDYNITKSYIRFGNATFERNGFSVPLDDFRLLHRQLPYIESLIKCLEMNWMTILTGGSGVGKTTLASIVSALTGRNLKTISMNPEIDATDLLGGFEQQDLLRYWLPLEKRFWNLLQKSLKCYVTEDNDFSVAAKILNFWFSYVKRSTGFELNAVSILTLTEQLENFLRECSSISNYELNSFLNDSSFLKSRCAKNRLIGNGIFEWVDSVLVNALKNGDWVLIDEANLCAPSVLDRLNSLLEPNGSLILTEKGVVADELSVIKPHKNFRLILAMNPAIGELSRAMRNRGIELFIPSEINKRDTEVLLHKFGFDNCSILAQLMSLYSSFVEDGVNEILCENHFLKYCKLLSYQIHRGYVGRDMFSHGLSNNEAVINDLKYSIGDVSLSSSNTDLFIFDNKIDTHFSNVCFHENVPVLECTKNQLYLEMSSASDFNIRKMLLSQRRTDVYIDANTYFIMINNIIDSFGREKYATFNLEEFPIDIRSVGVIWGKVVKNMNENELITIERSLNRWLLLCFCQKLVNIQRLSTGKGNSFLHMCDVQNAISRPSEFVKHTKKLIHVLDTKIFTSIFHLQLSNCDISKLRELLFWIHHLYLLCVSETSENTHEEFLVLWTILNEKLISGVDYFAHLSSQPVFLDITKCFDVNSNEIEMYCRQVSKHNTTVSFYNCVAGAKLFEKINEVCGVLFAASNQRGLSFDWFDTLSDLYSKIANSAIHHMVYEEIEKIISQIKLINCASLDESNDQNLVTFKKRNSTNCAQLTPLWNLCFFYIRTEDILRNKRNALDLTLTYKLLLHPLHLSLLKATNFDSRNLSFLYYFMDFDRLLNRRILNYWLNNDCFSEAKIEGKIFNNCDEFSSECCLNISMICLKTIHNSFSVGISNTRIAQLESLKNFLCSNHEQLTSENSFNFVACHTSLVRQWCSYVEDCCSGVEFKYRSLIPEATRMLDETDIKASGFALSLVGFASSHLFAPLTTVDPILRNNYKLKHYEMELNYINIELLLRRAFSLWKIGDVSGVVMSDIFTKDLRKRKEVLELKIEKLTRKYRIRPNTSQFHKLRNSVKHFLQMILDEKSIFDFFECLKEEKKSTTDYDKLLRKSLQIQTSISNFCNQLLNNYPHYSDLIFNFLIGVHIMLRGIKILTHQLKKETMLSQWKQTSETEFIELLKSLGSFSNMDPLLKAQRSLDVIKWMSAFTPGVSNRFPKVSVMLFKSTFLELQNAAIFRCSKTSILSLMLTIVNAFFNAWKIEQEKEAAKKEEEEALYKYKVSSFEGELAEEEQDKIDISATFPSFIEEYEDLLDPDILETKPNNAPVHQNLEGAVDKGEDLLEVFETQNRLVQILSNYYLNNNQPDFIKSYQLRYQILSHFLEYSEFAFGPKIESFFIEGHIVMSHKELCSKSVQFAEEKRRKFNIYRDCVPEEFEESSSLLQLIEQRICNLLKEFPEHPTLQRLLHIINRMLGFSVETSSIMKFVTGFELFLEEANEWESKAHRGISLRTELTEMTNLVIRWRKMELNNWTDCLDSVLEKIRNDQFLKWWFHFYSMLTALLNDEVLNEATLKQFVSHVKQFMEESKLGEFSVRLDILNRFYQFVCLFDNKSNYSVLSNVLFNIYSFYRQFDVSVNEKLIKEKIPIEKEVKDFVKIMRWNDQNFYAVKNAVAKSHKSLHRFMKNYKKVLTQPSSINSMFFDIKRKSTKLWSLEVEEPHVSKQNSVVTFDVFDGYPHLSKAGVYFKKAQKYSKRIVHSTEKLKREINAINQLSVTVIETLNEFQNLELPNQITDKEKWKKAVRQMHHSKQQSLSDLWKELARSGLSYKLGVQCFVQFDVDTILVRSYLLKGSSTFSSPCMTNIQSSNEYFVACLARFISLQKSMQSPSKELSRNQFDRIKGFCGHFVTLITRNNKCLSTELKNLATLKDFSSRFSSNSSVPLVNHDKMNQWIGVLHKLFIRLKSCMDQVISLLSCFCDNFDNVVQLKNTSGYFLQSKCSRDLIANVLQIATARMSETPLYNIINQDTLTEDDFEGAKAFFGELEAIANSVIAAFEQTGFRLEEHQSTSSVLFQLHNVCNQILVESINFQKDWECDGTDESSQEIEVFSDECEKLLLLLLSAIESLVKNANFQSQSEIVNDVFSIDNAIKNNCEISTFQDSFKSERVIRRLKSLWSKTYRFNSKKSLQKATKLISCVQCFVKHYVSLYEYFVSIFVASQRTTTKLFYILLGLFTDLCTKGFCLPAEIDETPDGKDEKTTFKDISDGGFGEGDGSKDVSEKIESEDQLEDTFKEGTQVEENESDNREIEDEEKGIEMSDDFDAQLFSPKENEGDKSDDDESCESDNEIDKKIGETDNNAETIDEKMWGSDDEEEDEESNENTENSGGEGRRDPRVVARDESCQNKEDDNDETEEITEVNDDINEQLQSDDYSGELDQQMKEPDSQTDNNKDSADQFPEEMELDTEDLNDDEESAMDAELSEHNMEDENDETIDEEMVDENGDVDKDDVTNLNSEAEMGTEDKEADEEIANEDDLVNNEKAFTDFKSNLMDPVNSEEKGMEHSTEITSTDANDGTGLAEAENIVNDINGKDTFSKPCSESINQNRLEKSGERQSVNEANNDVKRKPIIEASEKQTDSLETQNEGGDEFSEVYQHLKEGEKGDNQALDVTHQEEENKYRPNNEEEDAKEPSNADDFTEMTQDEKPTENEKLNQLKTKVFSHSNSNTTEKNADSQSAKSENEEEIQNINGEIVKSDIVSRGPQSTIHTQINVLASETEKIHKSWFEDLVKVRTRIDDDSEKQEISRQLWKEVESKVNPLVRELCQQLQLVLEPTKMSKLKGDYKTGKRLNMRKVISYIASQFRKDKIWLRRTKPSKREFQIIVAVDDSLSMDDNHSKQLAFESLALLAKSLTLIEAGEMAVMSFGEETQLLQSFDEPFTSSSGAKLLMQFQFNQEHTRIADMLAKALSLMNKHRRNTSADLSQLLLIISDGRGLFNEGEQIVRSAVQRMKSCGVFVLFIVIDNPNNKDSILDIRVPVFNESGGVLIETYMEKFPFPFYLILRDINSMPHVLGEALRQWFELVTYSDR